MATLSKSVIGEYGLWTKADSDLRKWTAVIPQPGPKHRFESIFIHIAEPIRNLLS